MILVRMHVGFEVHSSPFCNSWFGETHHMTYLLFQDIAVDFMQECVTRWLEIQSNCRKEILLRNVALWNNKFILVAYLLSSLVLSRGGGWLPREFSPLPQNQNKKVTKPTRYSKLHPLWPF